MPQIIILDDVEAQAGPNAERITMTVAERVAMRMPFLRHEVSPGELTYVAGEGLQARGI